MNDEYANYQELSSRERKGIDFVVQSKRRDSPFLIMAPHGGKIEKYTTDLARGIAGSEFSFYSFVGNKESNNLILHLASHCFDEPKALEAASGADVVITVHGQRSEAEELVMLGGRHAELIERFKRELERSNFFCPDPAGDIRGRDPRNLCNRGRSGMGVQFEISHRLRYHFHDDADLRNVFVVTVRSVLLSYRASGAGDPAGR